MHTHMHTDIPWTYIWYQAGTHAGTDLCGPSHYQVHPKATVVPELEWSADVDKGALFVLHGD